MRLNDGGSGPSSARMDYCRHNHHVALGQLQKNSTAEHDYVKDVYGGHAEPGNQIADLEVNVLTSMEDVTGKVNESTKGAKH